jgi:hypothetical protein
LQWLLLGGSSIKGLIRELESKVLGIKGNKGEVEVLRGEVEVLRG